MQSLTVRTPPDGAYTTAFSLTQLLGSLHKHTGRIFSLPFSDH